MRTPAACAPCWRRWRGSSDDSRAHAQKPATACASTGTCRSRWTTASCCAPMFSARSRTANIPSSSPTAPTRKASRSRTAIRARGSAWWTSIPTSRRARRTSIKAGKSSTPEKWVPHGYACVRVDSRGAGCSPGFIDHFSPRETKDFYDCIEWAGVQPWSNGKVGLNGISYYGINQWHVASLQPPHLAAMCVWEGAADWYRDMTHHGGMLSTFWANWYDMQVKTVQYGAGERGKRSRVHGELVCGPETLSEEQLAKNRCDFGDEIRKHPLDDDYHQARSPQWDKITAPLLSAANWGGQGLHPRGNFEGFVRAASKDKWLEAHGIEHWTHFYTDYGRELQRKFFDHLPQRRGHRLGQAAARAAAGAPSGEKFVERDENEWPIARTQVDQALSRLRRLLARRDVAHRRSARDLRCARRRRHVHDAAAESRDRDHRAGRGEAVRLVIDHRRRPVPRAARVLRRPEGNRVPGRDRSAHADRAGLAARLAPQARSRTDAALSAVSHPRREAAADARRRRSSSTSSCGRRRSWCRPAIASRSRVRGRDYEYGGDRAGGCRTSRTS